MITTVSTISSRKEFSKSESRFTTILEPAQKKFWIQNVGLGEYLFDSLLGLLLHVCELVLEVLDPPEVALSLLLQDADPHQVLPALLPSNLLHTSSLVDPRYLSRIPDPGVQKGTGSRIRFRNTGHKNAHLLTQIVILFSALFLRRICLCQALASTDIY